MPGVVTEGRHRCQRMRIVVEMQQLLVQRRSTGGEATGGADNEMDIEIVVAYIHVSLFDQKGTREATRAFKRLRKRRQRIPFLEGCNTYYAAML